MDCIDSQPHTPSSAEARIRELEDRLIATEHVLSRTRDELAHSRQEIRVIATQLKHSRRAHPRGTFKLQQRRLTIMHFNDVYHIAPRECDPCGGASRVAALIREVQQDGQHPMVICSGDMLGPSLISSITKGSHMISALNLIVVHYGVLGNHDFDFGIQNCAEQIKLSTATWLLSNVVRRGTLDPLVHGAKRTGFTRWGPLGIKVGLIGLVENWLPLCSKVDPDQAEHLDMAEVGKTLAVELKQAGAEVVVAITHNRLANDVALASALSGYVDLICGGHDHFYATDFVDGVAVVKSGSDFRDVSRIQIDIDPSEKEHCEVQWPCERIPITRSMPEAPFSRELVSRLEALVDAQMQEVVGTLETDLDLRECVLRAQESAAGNWVADVFCEAVGAEAALINGGGIRADVVLAAGADFTIKHVYQMFPFEDTLCLVELTGDQLRGLIENALSRLPAPDGRFPHLSGIRVTFDASAPSMCRVVSLQVRGEPVLGNQTYKVATCSFLASGKEGFTQFDHAVRLTDHEYEQPVQSVVLEWVRANGSLCAGLDGRMAAVPRLEPPVMRKSETARSTSDVRLATREQWTGLGRSVSCPEMSGLQDVGPNQMWRWDHLRSQF